MYDIIQKHGHYELYLNGVFVCSADTYGEAEKEMEA